MLLAGGDPGGVAERRARARATLPALRDRAAAPQLVGRDRCEELDGIGARADRYRAELARGRWQLHAGWPRPDPTHTQEAPSA